MLENWFEDINTIESFREERKVKLWVSMENFPLEAWNDDVFRGIAKRWGTLVKIEKETSRKQRFDAARLLIRAQLPHSIPARFNIFVNGVSYSVKATISEYEDEKCWISGSPIMGKDHSRSKEAVFGQASRRAAGFPVEEDGSVGDSSSNHINASNDDVPLETRAHAATINDNNVEHVLLCKKGPYAIAAGSVSGTCEIKLPKQVISGSDGLVEIPVSVAQESLKISIGSISSSTPILDKTTGTFNIRPKYASNPGLFVLSSVRSNVDKSQRLISLGQPQKNSTKSMNETQDCPSEKRTASRAFLDPRETVEVCRSVGLIFEATDEVVIRQLEVLGSAEPI
ncbi:hypothetical protein HRI_002624400 [Hibiscus trionum]|uniref:DUF4283 domain-containing protein n=1 Tax=Hibiscus trionum TaxID=183268 RepID=A0A9W7I618_HIBTR|nr:hypothetical protein HRI_002624400 [Hibiscus trionum]